jgi:hypothetical protein
MSSIGQKVKDVLHINKAEKHGNTDPHTHANMQGAHAHKNAGVEEGRGGAQHGKEALKEKVAKNAAEAKETLHIGNKQGQATEAKEEHKAAEKAHKAAAGQHVDKATDHAHAGAGYAENARSHETGTGTAGNGVRSGTGVAGTGVTGTGAGGNVIDQKYYTTTEDRPVDQEEVVKYREHNPYEKQYTQDVHATGRERQLGADTEVIGSAERVIGQDHAVQGHPQHFIDRNLPKGALDERPGGAGWVQGKPGPTCDEKTFGIQGDRTVDKEHTTALKEHRDFEKEFEINTREQGERQLGTGVHPEVLDQQRNVVGVKKTTPCEGHPEL